MTTKSYRAPWGRKIWLITPALVLFAIVLAVVMPFLIANEESLIVSFLPPGEMFLIIGVTTLFCVRRFEISDDAMHVVRSFWRNHIPLANLDSAEADPRACAGAWKTAGNDGLFAMHGWFRNQRLGRFQAFVTDPENSVVLRYGDRTIVISPENPRSFVNELNRRLRKQEDRP